MNIKSNSPRKREPELPGAAWERRIVFLLIAATLLLVSGPIAYAVLITPRHTQFIGVPYNIDDFCNYLSWMRQMADGGVLLRNLFTTDPQSHLQFNIFFWLLGRFAHLTGWSLPIVWHVVRLSAGLGLLCLMYAFYRFCIPRDRAARLISFGLTCFASGFGWWGWSLGTDRPAAFNPVDAWQPEAYTFLSLYTSALFTVSLLFIAGALYAMLLGERTGRMRYAVIAGLCGAVLGDIHSYDVIHISAAWGLFVVVWTIIRRGRGTAGTWGRSLVAGMIMAPTVLYQYYIFLTNPVFRHRAGVPTLSPAFYYYILGYGIPFALAVLLVAVFIVRAVLNRKKAKTRDPEVSHAEIALPFANTQTALFVLCWAIAGLAVIYLHLPFQRKMLMGEHFPLCLLAGAGASVILRRLRPPVRIALAAALVLASAPSNVLFLARDIRHLSENRSETGIAPFQPDGLLQACTWLKEKTPAGAAVIGFPDDCLLVPGLAGRSVWAGHWGETPEYGRKTRAFYRFSFTGTPDNIRPELLQMAHVQYMLYPTDVTRRSFASKSGRDYTIADFALATPPYLTKVYSNPDFTVFRINVSP